MPKLSTGRRSRFNLLKRKAEKNKGFGDVTVSGKCRYYEIEFLKDDELIELHWLKIAEPSREEKMRLRMVMVQAKMDVPGATEYDFLAMLHLGLSIFPRDTDSALAYRASRLYQSGVIKCPFGEVIRDEYHLNNPFLSTMTLKYCKIVDVVDGVNVTLSNRRGS